jgi:hypothetical protein
MLHTKRMAFFGLFSSEPSQKSIDKLVARIKERHAQPEQRREAMDKLLSYETTEAVVGLLQRFTVVVSSPHWDETEKRWLVDELAARAQIAREPLLRFLATNDSVAFAAQALKRMTPDASSLVDDLVGALTARPPEDHRTVQGKTELVAVLAEQSDGRTLRVIAPYLHDHSDDVQMASIDATRTLWPVATADDKAAAAAALQQVLADDARSARVLRHAAKIMATLGIAVDVMKPIPAAVAEDYQVKDGRLVSAHS